MISKSSAKTSISQTLRIHNSSPNKSIVTLDRLNFRPDRKAPSPWPKELSVESPEGGEDRRRAAAGGAGGAATGARGEASEGGDGAHTTLAGHLENGAPGGADFGGAGIGGIGGIGGGGGLLVLVLVLVLVLFVGRGGTDLNVCESASWDVTWGR